MKPNEWDTMTEGDKKDYATALFKSMRGVLLLSQVFEYGIAAMKAVPAPWTEVSNIEDLECIRVLFQFPVQRDFDVQMVPNRRMAARDTALAEAAASGKRLTSDELNRIVNVRLKEAERDGR